ncbi:hypothetical protein SAMN05216522_102271 [Rosenbergiella nectarea]|uniref:Phosphodiesterase n=1 Tax=Rosenbergiella nectarea TaxID=988801 RepID=A0A1H9FD11_9GAMM|nr:hypothetical protein [Rosenbergiella nectarea]SEQ35826.1 hypothetical protein SAMN05216522_102271 [Rosenbergiella nectarea]
MISISHRGYWLNPSEKNSIAAFKRSFSQGFGTETDIRDYCGELVISHDIPSKESISFEKFLNLFISYDHRLPLALNIKADGLAKDINEFLKFYKIDNYFCFDMSIPDTLHYLEKDMNVFMRRSEYEADNELFFYAKGIWLDSFHANSLDNENVAKYLELGKKVCIVSPELHRRDESEMWKEIKALPSEYYSSDQLLLCTDKIEKVVEYFYEK